MSAFQFLSDWLCDEGRLPRICAFALLVWGGLLSAVCAIVANWQYAQGVDSLWLFAGTFFGIAFCIFGALTGAVVILSGRGR